MSNSVLNIGLDRKPGLQGGFRSPSPREDRDMTPDILPSSGGHHHHQQHHRSSNSPSRNQNSNNNTTGGMGQHYFTVPSSSSPPSGHHHNNYQQHWENSSKGIDATKRRSPIMTSSGKKTSAVSVVVNNNSTTKNENEQDHNEISNPTTKREQQVVVDPTGGDISFENHSNNNNNKNQHSSNSGGSKNVKSHHHQQQNLLQSTSFNNNSSFSQNAHTTMNFSDATPTRQQQQQNNNNNSTNIHSMTPQSPNSGANTPSWVKKQLQELQHSPYFNKNKNGGGGMAIGTGSNKRRRNSASIGTVNRQTVSIVPGPSNNNNNNHNNVNDISGVSSSSPGGGGGAMTKSSSFVKLSPVHFSAASHFGNKKAHFGHPAKFNNNNHNNNNSLAMMNISTTSSDQVLYSSPVAPTASDPVNFYFVNKQKDPVKEQLRRADAIIAALPSKDASPLPPVIDTTGNPMSSAAVLDGLVNRTTLLQLEHDRTAQNQQKQQNSSNNNNNGSNNNVTNEQQGNNGGAFLSTSEQQKQNKDRTANAIMGIHIAALLDLSRSLAITDPNASQVARRVHEVLTSHVVKSVEEPLERVSTLYDQARRHAEQARDQSSSLKSQLLDAQAEIQALKRQVRKRDDMIAYLTSAYSLPTVFKDTTSDNPDLVSQALMAEASPSAMLNQKKNHDAKRRSSVGEDAVNAINSGGRRRSFSQERNNTTSNTRSPSGSGRRRNNNGGDDDGSGDKNNEINSWYDPNKSLQEQFQVIIPSQQEKEKVLSEKNKKY